MAQNDLDITAYGRLTSLIYRAVLDQRGWAEFLAEVTQVTGGIKTHLFGFDIPGGISLGLTAAGYDPDYIDSYNSHYGTMNAWAVGFANGTPGVVMPSETMYPKNDLFRTEFYNDWVRPQENVAAGGGALIFKDANRMLAFGGNIRLKDEERLEEPWLRMVGLLVPHLEQAFEISRALAGRSLELDLLRKGQIRENAAVLLLADNGFVLYANEAGVAMLQQGIVLRDDHAGRAGSSDDAVAAMLDSTLRALRRGMRPVAASRRSHVGADNYIIRVAQFEPEAHPVGTFPLVLAYSRDCLLVTIVRERDVRDADSAFALEHGLTVAEAAVAAGIADGMRLEELAGQIGVSVHTIRGQTKSILSKLGVRRQTELVRMLERARSGTT